MPEMHVTSYGYCYHVLIVSNLIKSGIPQTDDGIGASFNFGEELAFELFRHADDPGAFDFQAFVDGYGDRFLTPASILSRLHDPDYGIITVDGKFRTEYMYYYFLGLYLSKHTDACKDEISAIYEDAYVPRNYLTLLFIIHHTNDHSVIDDILLRVMCTFDSVFPATLTKKETRRFGEIVGALSANLLSDNDVKEERRRAREIRDHHEAQDGREDAEPVAPGDFRSNCYRMFRSNAILAQVLRNKYGVLEKDRVEEIVETIADGGLRVVNSLLEDEKEIEHKANYIHKEFPDLDLDELRFMLQLLSFLWTITNVQMVADAINHPEIRPIVDNVVRKRDTPAYDLICYFTRVDSATELTSRVKDMLRDLLKRYDDRFIHGVLSIKTQLYMNTHHSKVSVEQAVCSLLNLEYTPRYR